MAEWIDSDQWCRVLVELDYHDGPRGGIVELDGNAWYFQSTYEDVATGGEDVFSVWPAPPTVLQLEREAWRVFVAWNDDYEAGMATTNTHPGTHGVNQRYDEIERLLSAARKPPSDAVLAAVEFRWSGEAKRYAIDGLDYFAKARSRRGSTSS